MSAELPPFVVLYAAGLMVLLCPKTWQGGVLLSSIALSALNLWLLPADLTMSMDLMGMALQPVRIDRLSLLFGYLFHIAAAIGAIYSMHTHDRLQQAAGMFYAGSAVGAAFAGDMLTLYVFWELLGLSSVFLIWARRSELAYRAGMRYFAVQVVSGLLLLAGVIVHYQQQRSLAFGYVGLEGLAGWLIFIALGIKCAFPALHNWLVDAYPEAPPTGTFFLSAFTTKVAIYAMARAFPGTELLVYIGAVMACFPVFYALLENDLRRVLAYSMVNQLGFMVVGIGVGSKLAINGAVAHAFNEVIFKGLLFMTMGAVLYRTGRIKASELGGLYRSMPKTAALCIIGAASISAVPLFSGFVSKSMILSATLKAHFNTPWLALLFASAGVLLYVGIKLPYFAFFAQDRKIQCDEAPTSMLLAMAIAAALCLAVGIFPGLLYSQLPYAMHYTPYKVGHILTQTQLLLFSALAFVWLYRRGLYPPPKSVIHLDTDWVYRKPLPRLLQGLGNGILRLDSGVRVAVGGFAQGLWARIYAWHGQGGILSRNISISAMVTWVVAFLALLLIAQLV